MAESEGVQRPCVLWLCAAVDVADPGVACATQASGTTIHIRPIAELWAEACNFLRLEYLNLFESFVNSCI